MNHIKKSLIISIIVIICINAFFTGCALGNKKYDVAIRVASDDGDLQTFTINKNEIHIERVYDGLEHFYFVSAYQLPRHPKWGNKWLEVEHSGANTFNISLTYVGEDGRRTVVDNNKIKDRGEYSYHINADSSSDIWNVRFVYLYITIA